MLVITRRVEQKIMIGSDIRFTILGVQGKQVRIGIEAPHEIAVHREEIYQRIKVEGGAESKDET